jgi:hypothetical protein
MQPSTAAPRGAYTDAQITALIRDTSDVEIAAGLELIDMTLEVETDLTDWLHGGTVTRNSYANLHGAATLELSRELDWGRSVVRPYVTLDGVRFNLGAYFADVPSVQAGSDPVIYSISGHDILLALADRIGQAYAVQSGANVLDTIEQLLIQQGFVRYSIDQSASSFVMPSARVWPIDDNTTWLTVVNDLLAAVGYAGVWSDWDGRLRCEQYVSPLARASEWTYAGDGDTSQLSVERVIKRDLFDAPNRWIAVR